MGSSTLERVNLVVEVLKAAKGETVTTSDLISKIGKAGLSTKGFYPIMQTAKKTHPGRIVSYNKTKSKSGELSGYAWIFKPGEMESDVKEEKPVMEEKKTPVEVPDDRYSDKHNDEGYLDPTAFMAMKNFTDYSGETNPKPGDIWRVTNSKGTVDEYLVLASKKSSITCLTIARKWSDIHAAATERYETLMVSGKEVYIDCVAICTKPYKYFIEKTEELTSACFAKVKGFITMYLGLDGGIVYVDKPVERVVEIPVEKVVEKEVIKEIPVELEKIVEKEVPVEVMPEGTWYSEDDVYERVSAAVQDAVVRERAVIYKEQNDKLFTALASVLSK